MRYLFCFPQGGISNMFEVIWRCLEYCKNHSRILVIDTRYTSTFRANIHEYFKFESDIIYKGDIDLLFNSVKNGSIYPNIFTIPETYKSIVSKFKFSKFGYLSNQVKVSISLKEPYDEDVVLFSHCIGGTGIKYLVKNMVFTPKLQNELSRRMSFLPKDYIGIHIRHTDRTSDYISFLKEKQDVFIGKKIFVASDNWECINYVKNKFGVENVFTFSEIPKELTGKPIHENNWVLDRERFVLDCFCDFFMLCMAKEYYYTCKESGFSKNVEILRELGKTNF